MARLLKMLCASCYYTPQWFQVNHKPKMELREILGGVSRPGSLICELPMSAISVLTKPRTNQIFKSNRDQQQAVTTVEHTNQFPIKRKLYTHFIEVKQLLINEVLISVKHSHHDANVITFWWFQARCWLEILLSTGENLTLELHKLSTQLWSKLGLEHASPVILGNKLESCEHAIKIILDVSR